MNDNLDYFMDDDLDDPMDDNLYHVSEFEEIAWRQFNSRPESDPLPADLSNRLNVAWSRLELDLRNRVATAADRFLSAQHEYKSAKSQFDGLIPYQGSPDDDDQFGQEKRRPDFQQYANAKVNLLNALRPLYIATQGLRQDRPLLGLPNNDYGARLLNTLENQYAAILPTLQSEVDKLPNERQDAVKKLGPRKRIAEARLDRPWEGQWPLGKGTFGQATLFVKQDSSGRIADHVVIKESTHGSTRYIWELKELWTGWKGPDDPTSIPNEIQAMYNLRDKIGSENIVKIRNWRIRRRNMYHRIYMEFCPYGDLYDLCCGIKNDVYDAGHDRREQFPNTDLQTQVEMLPEPFLWSVLWSLTEAGLLMERGSLDKDGADTDSWDLIVHRDLKVSNVFVSWRSDKRFKQYPTLRVADFGLCLLMPPNNDRTAEDYTRHGTPGNRAPEHAIPVLNNDSTTKMVSSKTNVWNVGSILWSMICSQEGFQEPYISWQGLPEVADLDLTARLYYSEVLQNLIYRCLRVNDEERPTFDELMEEIKEHTGDGPFDLASGLRDAPRNNPRWSQNALRWSEGTWRPNMLLSNAFPRPGGGQYYDPPPPGILYPEDNFGGYPGAEVVGTIAINPPPGGGG